MTSVLLVLKKEGKGEKSNEEEMEINENVMKFSAEQFERLLAKIRSLQRRSFTSCTVRYDGKRDTATVGAFLDAVTAYKTFEDISDEEAIFSVPLLLEGDAAIWWLGVKNDVSTWADFQSRLRDAFAPKRPAYRIYQDIVGIKQEDEEFTAIFLSKKRILFAQLPEPAHTESQQLDMVYGQLRFKIREKVPRDSVSTYDELLNAAREVEHMLDRPDTHSEQTNETVLTKKVRCDSCRNSVEVAKLNRKKARKQASMLNTTSTSTQAPLELPTSSSVAVQIPSEPKFSCYGCGAPGVVRSNCQTCLNNKPKINKEISFW